jgi:hypothetical protein
MATIKSYSDLQQSEKLAEILPYESADMKWFFWKEEIDAPKPPTFGYSKTAAESYKNTEAVYLPCWSLSALLGVLPFPVLYMEMLGEMILWSCESHLMETDEVVKIEHYNNPVDACVEMIERLHELKML